MGAENKVGLGLKHALLAWEADKEIVQLNHSAIEQRNLKALIHARNFAGVYDAACCSICQCVLGPFGNWNTPWVGILGPGFHARRLCN